jgi:fatty-acyl-CoA synthase
MDATMMQYPLTTQMIVERGEHLFPESRVLTFDGNDYAAATYADIAVRARSFASALAGIGLEQGDRIGTFAWNNATHLEAYLGAPAAGYVLHTLNVRLFADQLIYIVEHAADRAILVEASLLPLLEPVLAGQSGVEHLIVFNGTVDAVPGFRGAIHSYDDLVASHTPVEQWPELAENSAAVICYTSGTTGNPKGVVYSHRSILLHSLGSLGVDAFAISNRDNILMMPPMFHANAWGLPFSGWFAGSDMVMPGPNLQPDKIAKMAAATSPTLTATVPTILNDLLQLHARSPIEMRSFRTIIGGGSAISPVLIERVKEAWGVDVVQGWGMTETSPMCVVSFPPRDATGEAAVAWRARSGRPVAGMQVRAVDDQNRPVAEDGKAVGNLQLRGPWVAAGYYRQPSSEAPLTEDGWFETGDVGTIDERGYVLLTDRTKDLIKSGGEWISSVDLENRIARFPGVVEVAVIAVPDSRWEERPLAILVVEENKFPDFAEIRQYLAGQIAKFMIPEYWAGVPSLPKTSVGKIDKKLLRGEVQNGNLPYQTETGFGCAEHVYE